MIIRIWWPLFIVLIGFFSLVGLGTWQLYRLKTKEVYIEQIKEKLGEPVQALPSSVEHPEDLNYHAVTFDGKIDLDQQLYLMPRMYNGQKGKNLLVPVERNNGQVVLVDYGWLPDGKEVEVKNQAQDQDIRNEQTTITGIAQVPRDKNFWQPDNNISKKEIFAVNIDQIANELKLNNLQKFMVIKQNINPDGTMSSDPIITDLGTIVTRRSFFAPHHHLQYAITWYSLAFVLLCIYGIYVKRYVTLSKEMDMDNK